MKTLAIFTTFLAMAAGNYVFQYWFAEIPNYTVATDRTFFQGVAILILAAAGHFRTKAL